MIDGDFEAIRDKLEPGASAGGGEVEPYLISIAISLKRIADALPSGDGIHGFVLDLAYQAGTNFEGGRRV